MPAVCRYKNPKRIKPRHSSTPLHSQPVLLKASPTFHHLPNFALPNFYRHALLTIALLGSIAASCRRRVRLSRRRKLWYAFFLLTLVIQIQADFTLLFQPDVLYKTGYIFNSSIHPDLVTPYQRPSLSPTDFDHPPTSFSGGPEICTANLDGSGETDEQVTKDCCAAVNQQAYFNEVQKECMPYSGPAGNSVDTGAMVKCCSSRGRGSKAV